MRPPAPGELLGLLGPRGFEVVAEDALSRLPPSARILATLRASDVLVSMAEEVARVRRVHNAAERDSLMLAARRRSSQSPGPHTLEFRTFAERSA